MLSSALSYILFVFSIHLVFVWLLISFFFGGPYQYKKPSFPPFEVHFLDQLPFLFWDSSRKGLVIALLGVSVYLRSPLPFSCSVISTGWFYFFPPPIFFFLFFVYGFCKFCCIINFSHFCFLIESVRVFILLDCLLPWLCGFSHR